MFEGGWLHSPCIGYWGRGVGEEGGKVLDGIPGHLGKLGHHRGSEEKEEMLERRFWISIEIRMKDLDRRSATGGPWLVVISQNKREKCIWSV